MLLININGPINSGKTTISKILSSKIENSLFIEVDDLLSDEEKEHLGLGFKESIALRLERLDKLLKEHVSQNKYQVIIFAYPC